MDEILRCRNDAANRFMGIIFDAAFDLKEKFGLNEARDILRAQMKMLDAMAECDADAAQARARFATE